ncbi:uncharacterized protein LOC121730650 [Aricia agestis]|uniref:uncharacterized protein LOC121730650 n=1 Tax=Aricia agestis TaxID=91739 RepID=UPI001C20AADC|nr:uncharacterized protein LOC121730650 [Aricia agestis]
MVLADFLTETRRKWLQAFKLFKSKKSRKSARNRVSPALDRSFNGTVDARPEIDVHRFCPCRTSLPHEDSYSSSISGEYNSISRESNSCISRESNSRISYSRESHPDSAYESDRGSPARVCYTVTYFNVNDSEDSSSIHTEYTLLDYDADAEEETQNFINESIELVSSL